MKSIYSLVVVLFVALPLLGQPINADPNVTPVSLSQLEALGAPTGIWQELDSLDFWQIPLIPPNGYYDPTMGQEANRLRGTLHDLIEGHAVFSYSNSSKPGDANHIVDTWDIIALADEHPEEDAHVLDVYLNGTFNRQLKGPKTSFRYDREHSWPNSLGYKSKTKNNPAYSDCHALFAAYQPYNGSRSNKAYGDSSAVDEDTSDRKRPTNRNVGRGGTEGDEANYSHRNAWETWLARRGDVARAMFYMAVRYDGHVEEGRKEPDLKLTDDFTKVIARNDAWRTGAEAFMGIKSDLLRWHEDDPVDDLERRRNTVVYLFQGNRNPFIDNPEWVELLFGDGELPTTPVALPWINELHYDNVSVDQGEFVEVAGPAGTNLSGWRLIAYNGSNGLTYRTLDLNGVIDDENTSGFGAVSFPIVGLQNGSPDGVALISPTNDVVQLLSYEGTFTAGNGVARDETSDEIPVEESSNTPVGRSLQLQGTGNKYGDFDWSGPASASPGTLNQGQSIRRLTATGG